MYRFVDAALMRAVALPSSLAIPSWPDLTGNPDEQVAQWRTWLRQVWAIKPIADAIEVASPVLAHRVRGVCDGDFLSPRQVRRAVLSIVRYVLRATSRPTPFGLFAGIAPARFGHELHIRFGEQHHTTARVDSEWLAGVVTRLETCSELWRRLPVVLNNLAFVRDGRLVVGCQQLLVHQVRPLQRRCRSGDRLGQSLVQPPDFLPIVTSRVPRGGFAMLITKLAPTESIQEGANLVINISGHWNRQLTVTVSEIQL